MSDERPPNDPDDRADGDGTPADEPSREGTANGGHSDEQSQDRTAEHPESPGERHETETERGGRSNRVAFWISVAIGVVLAVGSIGLVSARAPFFENIMRVRPTVEGGGVAADWIVGNTEPILEWLIVLDHFADVVLGIFILVMVFLHWAAFRRLAARMQPPRAQTRTQETATATDGGTRPDGGETGSSRESRTDDSSGRTDGGESP